MSNLDLNELHKDLLKSINEDNLYWIRNEAKFRATRQGCSFEEFDAIVKASHLNPVTSKDLKELKTNQCLKWNPKLNNSSSQHIHKTPQRKRQTTTTTTTLKIESSDLKSLNPLHLKHAFKNELYSPELLVKIFIDILDNHAQHHRNGSSLSTSNPEELKTSMSSEDLKFIWTIIKAVHSSKRLDINIGFLSKKQIQIILNITRNVFQSMDFQEEEKEAQIKVLERNETFCTTFL